MKSSNDHLINSIFIKTTYYYVIYFKLPIAAIRRFLYTVSYKKYLYKHVYVNTVYDVLNREHVNLEHMEVCSRRGSPELVSVGRAAAGVDAVVPVSVGPVVALGGGQLLK